MAWVVIVCASVIRPSCCLIDQRQASLSTDGFIEHGARRIVHAAHGSARSHLPDERLG
jgi:hypothetical protein